MQETNTPSGLNDQGAEVELSLVKGKLVVTPLKKPAYSLEDLLEGVTEDNLHKEEDTRHWRRME